MTQKKLDRFIRFISAIFLIFIFALAEVSAQSDADSEEVAQEIESIKISINWLKKENSNLKKLITALNLKLKNSDGAINNLKTQTAENSTSITVFSENAAQNFVEIDKSISKKTIYGIGAFALLAIISLLLYFYLRKNSADLVSKLNQDKRIIEEKLIGEFDKQAQIMGELISLIQQQKNIQPITNQEPDHSLSLKVAGEINLIERNISFMDSDVKGLKQLKRSVERLKDNLKANGYEMPELLGKKFNQGMIITVINSIPDENLEKGEEKITKILIPQVNYNDKMIQAAQVEISIGI
ncbi:MAG: septum formation initiator [Elusimicrobiota bacterium]|jgi:prefoldin subunit 5|nr:septum formation initiator [Elusimicrobiota bacterium]